MKVRAYERCDFCGKEAEKITGSFEFARGRKYKIVEITTFFGMYPFADRDNIDMCPDCYGSMEQWVNENRKDKVL